MRRWREHVLVVVTLLGLWAIGVIDAFRTSLIDWRFDQAKRPVSGQVVVVGVDAASLSAVGVWPWPRSVHAQLLARLQQAGAAEVAFDVDFSSRTTPVEDRVFAQALSDAGGGTILPVFKQLSGSSDGTPSFISTRPLPEFAEQAWLGAVNIAPDPDGKARRYPIGLEIGGAYHPSLASLLAGAPQQVERSFLLDYSIDLRKLPKISALDVLEGRAGDLSGKKVVIGATAIELGDHFAAPRYGIVSGVEVQALAAEAVLAGRMLRQTGWPVALGGLVLIALFGAFVMRRLSAMPATAALGGAAVLVELGARLVQASTPLVMDTAPWLLALGAYCAWNCVRELDLRGMLASVAQQRFQSIAVTLADGVICTDTRGRITFWNPAAETIFRCPATAALGRDACDFLKGGRAAVEGVLNAQAKKGGEAIELAGVRSDGEEFPLEVRLSTWNGEAGRNYSVIVRDITSRRRSEARVRHLAMHDGLTDLANRSLLCDEIRERLERAGPETRFGVLLIDLDNFKEVNDKLGHDGGDALLRWFAGELRARIAPADCVARLGGDEFAVVCDLAEVEVESVVQAISGILGRGDRHTFVDGRGFLLSASIGSAQFPADGSSVDELLSNSDLGLYRAKKSGRGLHVPYAPGFKDEIESTRALEAELRVAIDEGQFEAFLQPQHSLDDGRIVGAEALIRWHHPTRGIVQPGQFLPVLTASRMATEVGELVMRQACTIAAQWAQAGKGIRIGVNLVPTQFNPELPKRIAQILAETGLAPDLLEIEITENILLTDDEKTIALLREVRDLGVCVALDDFGTGFASLTHLRRFPLDRLKIDRSFVTTFGSDAANTAIVTAIVGLARQLGLQTIAEGIEDADCVRLLAAAGCTEGQGYHFGKAMRGAEFTALLERQAAAQAAA